MMVIDKYNLTSNKNICIVLRAEFIQVTVTVYRFLTLPGTRGT